MRARRGREEPIALKARRDRATKREKRERGGDAARRPTLRTSTEKRAAPPGVDRSTLTPTETERFTSRNRQADQPAHQSATGRPTNRPTNQPTSQRPADQPTATNQPTDQPADQSAANQPTATNRSTKRPRASVRGVERRGTARQQHSSTTDQRRRDDRRGDWNGGGTDRRSRRRWLLRAVRRDVARLPSNGFIVVIVAGAAYGERGAARARGGAHNPIGAHRR